MIRKEIEQKACKSTTQEGAKFDSPTWAMAFGYGYLAALEDVRRWAEEERDDYADGGDCALTLTDVIERCTVTEEKE